MSDVAKLTKGYLLSRTQGPKLRDLRALLREIVARWEGLDRQGALGHEEWKFLERARELLPKSTGKGRR